MAVKKISIALEEDIAEAATTAATAHGQSLSSWLNQAARMQLRIERGLAAVREWEEDHGAFTEGERNAARGALNNLLAGSRRDE